MDSCINLVYFGSELGLGGLYVGGGQKDFVQKVGGSNVLCVCYFEEGSSDDSVSCRECVSLSKPADLGAQRNIYLYNTEITIKLEGGVNKISKGYDPAVVING